MVQSVFGKRPTYSSTRVGGLQDVTITSVSDKQTLRYDETIGEWVNSTDVEAGVLTVNTGMTIGFDDNVDQLTDEETDVTSNSRFGMITTQVCVCIPGEKKSFTVNNTEITSSDPVILLTHKYTGAGSILSYVGSSTPGSFDIVMVNAGTLNSDGQVVIHYMILKP